MLGWNGGARSGSLVLPAVLDDIGIAVPFWRGVCVHAYERCCSSHGPEVAATAQ